jgi:methylenetetrahydrofolate dehydrogenase (NADP+)/methenyltetrahydrofolate cyclohydrolase
MGVIVLLNHYHVPIAGKHAVLVNRSKLVGRPLSQLLLNEDATVTICHSKTQNIRDLCKQGDILLTGIGRRSEFVVGADFIMPGAAVVDIGTSSLNGKIVGDVDFDAATHVASCVSPVPGGVGPMTISMLLYNSLLTACLQKGVEMEVNVQDLTSYGSA